MEWWKEKEGRLIARETSARVSPGKKSISGERSKGDEPPWPAPKKRRLCDYAEFGVTSGTIHRGQQELTCGILMAGAISPWPWVVHGTPGLRLVSVVIAEGENASVAATILGPSVQICRTIGEASALPRPAVIFDETAQRSASLVGTVALARHFPLRRTPEGLTKTDLKGNHWDYGGVSTASATLKVYSRAGEVVTACEALARYRRDLKTIVKGDVQGPKHRLDTSPLSDGPAVVILSKLKGVPVISARGLAPVEFDSWVVTPCFRAGPGVQVRRKLSLEEKLAVLDVPQAGIDLLVSRQWEHCALGLAPAMLLGGLWGDFLCHEGGCLPRRTVQTDEKLLGKRSQVETGWELAPAGQRRKVIERTVETVSEEAFFNSSKAMVSASSVETGSGGLEVDYLFVELKTNETCE